MNTHEHYMKRCLELAIMGKFDVAPNPMVGCVIVHHDKIVAEGYHQYFGGAHAEVNAINSLTDQSILGDCTVYVSLEPCNHHGKTPPCTELLISKGIKKVVIGATDPHALVAGSGIKKLNANGIEVIVDVLKTECEEVNKRFFTMHSKQRPYIILKWAESSDGFTSKIPVPKNRMDNLITSEKAHKISQFWRAEEQAILVGKNTVLLDNPFLTNRSGAGKSVLRIFIDKNLEVPLDYHIYNHESKTIVVNQKKSGHLKDIEFFQADFNQKIIPQILFRMVELNINSILVEGGTQLINSFLEAGIWDEARTWVATKKLESGLRGPRFLNNGNMVIDTGEEKLFITKNEA